MKKRLLLTLAAASLGLAGCNDKAFLTETPKDFVGPANFYRNAGDAIAAINSVYATFVNLTGDSYYGRNFPMLVDYPTEMVTSGRLGGTNERSQPDVYTVNADHAYVLAVWQSAYQAINRANAVIDRVPNIAMDATLRDRIVGEAKFLRALHYFNLVRLYGGVPLRLSETTTIENLEMARSTELEVYAQIEKDLAEAFAVLPATYPATDRGRVTSGAAQALLGQALLQKAGTGVSANATQDYEAAITQLRGVVATGRYSLVPNFATMFDVYGGTLNENNAEFIFAVENVRVSGLGGRMSQHSAPNLAPGLGTSASGSITAEQGFFNEFATADTRRDGTWLLTWRRSDTGVNVTCGPTLPCPSAYIAQTPFPRKYLDPQMTGVGTEEPNYPILRYANVLLMLAEAINEAQGPTAEAQEFLNQVRRRAGIGDFPAAGVTKASLKDEIFLQRRKEFVLEFQGLFDSQRHWEWAKARIEFNLAQGRLPGIGQRWPRTQPSTPVTLTNKHKRYPIPNLAIQLSKGLIEQSPDWATQ